MPGVGRGSRPARGSQPRAPARSPDRPARDAGRQQDESGQKWMEFTEGVLRADLRAVPRGRRGDGRLRRPAPRNRRATTRWRSSRTPPPTSSPRTGWTGRRGSSGKAAGLDLAPLRVRYLRTDQRARPAAVLAYYRRQLPHCQEHALPQGVWLDALLPAGAVRGALDRHVDHQTQQGPPQPRRPGPETDC